LDIRSSLLQRFDGVVRNAAVADERDFFGHSRIPVNFHCDSSSMV
jgi:hypothetical protein